MTAKTAWEEAPFTGCQVEPIYVHRGLVEQGEAVLMQGSGGASDYTAGNVPADTLEVFGICGSL